MDTTGIYNFIYITNFIFVSFHSYGAFENTEVEIWCTESKIRRYALNKTFSIQLINNHLNEISKTKLSSILNEIITES